MVCQSVCRAKVDLRPAWNWRPVSAAAVQAHCGPPNRFLFPGLFVLSRGGLRERIEKDQLLRLGQPVGVLVDVCPAILDCFLELFGASGG